MSPTDMRGSTAPNAIWNTICMSPAERRIALKRRPWNISAQKHNRAVGGDQPRASAKPSVVLPKPDSPTTPQRFALAHL